MFIIFTSHTDTLCDLFAFYLTRVYTTCVYNYIFICIIYLCVYKCLVTSFLPTTFCGVFTASAHVGGTVCRLTFQRHSAV